MLFFCQICFVERDFFMGKISFNSSPAVSVFALKAFFSPKPPKHSQLFQNHLGAGLTLGQRTKRGAEFWSFLGFWPNVSSGSSGLVCYTG